MPDFRYKARGADGKLVEGVVSANDRSAAMRQIEQQKLTPIRISAADTSASSPASAGVPNKESSSTTPVAAAKPDSIRSLNHSQLHLFTEQLAHLLVAGMTLDEGLGILCKRLKHPKLGGLAQALHQGLVDGRSLSQCLKDFPRIFSSLYINMVAAGEASGALAEILRRLTTHLANLKALRDRVQQALLYPAILVLVGIALVITFMTVMVPKLLEFFQKTKQELPTPTKILIAVDHVFVAYWWVGILASIGIYFGWKAFVATEPGRYSWDTLMWRFPLISSITRHRFYAQFARTLGTLTHNGVTLLRSLELMEDIAGNEFVRRKLASTRTAVVDGATLSTALGHEKLFPELFVDMLAVGEQTGRFGDTMHMVADIYERELDKQVKIVSELVPPIVMICIASVIGFVVFSILAAVMSMTQGLRPRR